MPRNSPFDMNLSSDERQVLESMSRKYTSPYCDVIRAKIILLAHEGLSNDLIAARLDTPRQFVSKSLRKVWSPRSAAPLCGAGSAAMPFALGSIEAGSSLAIRTLPTRPA